METPSSTSSTDSGVVESVSLPADTAEISSSPNRTQHAKPDGDVPQGPVLPPEQPSPRTFADRQSITFPSLQEPPLGFMRVPDNPNNLVHQLPPSAAPFYINTTIPPSLPQREHPMLPMYAQPLPPPGYTAPMLPASYYSGHEPHMSVRPAQFLYYNQIPSANRPEPYIAWTTHEANAQYAPMVRQRSAKACNKCRKRKTKVLIYLSSCFCSIFTERNGFLW